MGCPYFPKEKPFKADDFRDKKGRMRRQAARFRVFRCNEKGEPEEEMVPGRGNLKRIHWTVHPANKKSVWYQFQTRNGQNGYASNHPFRNADITNREEREQMIIDPGPRTLTGPKQRATFARGSSDGYPESFPPENLEPKNIDTLGEILTDSRNRLIFVGGYGHAGSTYRPVGIVEYANNDGWWDDTSDGPVTATLEFFRRRRGSCSCVGTYGAARLCSRNPQPGDPLRHHV